MNRRVTNLPSRLIRVAVLVLRRWFIFRYLATLKCELVIMLRLVRLPAILISRRRLVHVRLLSSNHLFSSHLRLMRQLEFRRWARSIFLTSKLILILFCFYRIALVVLARCRLSSSILLARLRGKRLFLRLAGSLGKLVRSHLNFLMMMLRLRIHRNLSNGRGWFIMCRWGSGGV